MPVKSIVSVMSQKPIHVPIQNTVVHLCLCLKEQFDKKTYKKKNLNPDVDVFGVLTFLCKCGTE